MRIINQSAFDKWDIADESVQAIITSPPYYLCRTYKIPDVVIGGDTNCEHDFGNVTVKTPNAAGGQGYKQDTVKGSSFVDYHNRQISSSICSKCNALRGQYGNEESVARYIKHTLLWLKEAYRVLKENGCLFVVLDDKYSGSNMGRGTRFSNLGKNTEYYDYSELHSHMPKDTTFGVKRKSLLLIPERIMIAMSDAGWIIRNKIWWSRTLPEPCKDRFSAQSETIIFATKSPNYYFDLSAVREPVKQDTIQRYLRAFNSGKANNEEGSFDITSQRKMAEKFKAIFGEETTEIYTEGAETIDSSRTEYHRQTEIIAKEHGYDPDGICPVCSRTWKRHASPNAKDRKAGIRRDFIPCVSKNKYDNEGKKVDEMCGGEHVEYGGINANNSIYKEKLMAGNESCLFKNPGNIWLDLYLDAHRQAINELGTEGYIEALKSWILSETDLFPPFVEGLHENHFAPFSEKLINRLILCSTKAGDIVLDPFAGSCTTGRVAIRLQRQFVGLELGYFDISLKRCSNLQLSLLT
ncbi:MAG: DNA adenine methyltransferase YhdJ [candidate division WS2 bacterium]|nr:DNA adenine methyltransferase YhdJ [Candidatus Lithacetigena glycinireducens]